MLKKYYFIHILLCLCVAQNLPYCGERYERLCRGKGPHIACQFPYPGRGECCENYTAIVFTNGLKKFILNYVNGGRQNIAAGNEGVRDGELLPKPEIMMMVQWDSELAFLAQRLADQCQFAHDHCRATDRYPYAGQTVGEVRWNKSSSEMGLRRVIGRVLDAWWGERRRVRPTQLIAPFVLTREETWGHFSQLAVWTLRAMGCGAVHHGSTTPRLLLVCDFSHTNMLGQPTINPRPLAPCPFYTARKPTSPYPLLCAPISNNQIEAEELFQDEDAKGECKETVEEQVNVRPYTTSIVYYSHRPDRPIQEKNVQNTSKGSNDVEEQNIENENLKPITQ